MKVFFAAQALLVVVPSAYAFQSALFQEIPTLQKMARSKHDGVDIELPDFDELFDRIQRVSPLAKQTIARSPERGFAGMDMSDLTASPELPWKTVESNPRRVVHKIEKIDNFRGLPAPLLRFSASLEGPCLGPLFARFIMDLEQRKKWDVQIDNVYEAYPIVDLDSANIAMQFGKYGDCARLGIGYCQTKSNGPIKSREQLTLCGIQEFHDSSSIVWGTEMEDWHNHLLPDGKRFPRAKSHLFCTTLRPTGENTFDVEYVLQLESGGSLPTWLTTPVIIDSVKKMFVTCKDVFAGKCDTLDKYIAEQKEHENMFSHHSSSLLITP